MNWSEASAELKNCSQVREDFSPYLDGDMSGTAMQSMAVHLRGCGDCAVEFAAWRDIQGTLGSMGPAKAPAGLQARLRAVLAEERQRGAHLSWDRRVAAMWHATLAPFAFQAATGTVAALLLIGGAGALVAWFGAPSEVQANDERTMTAPHFLYSEVPPQPIEFGREAPVLIEAKVDDQGRVYDYTILSGPTDKSVQRAVEANLLSSVFQPATIFGLPVAGHVVMTFTGVSVKG